MLLATVPAAPPTRKNQRTTSCPAPISANVPYQRGSRLILSALEWVSIASCFTEWKQEVYQESRRGDSYMFVKSEVLSPDKWSARQVRDGEAACSPPITSCDQTFSGGFPDRKRCRSFRERFRSTFSPARAPWVDRFLKHGGGHGEPGGWQVCRLKAGRCRRGAFRPRGCCPISFPECLQSGRPFSVWRDRTRPGKIRRIPT